MTEGIPTVYQVMRFRSRLEAKWARFFDFCGWKWSYEPYDLAGWIPDFAIGDRLQTLVEVKPVMSVTELYEADIAKIERNTARTDNVIVLGADPTTWLDGTPDCGAPCIGWSVYNGDLHFGWTEGNGFPGLCCMGGAWLNYVWHFEGDEPGRRAHKMSRVWSGNNVPMDARTMLVTYWRKACNETQWMARENHGN